MELLFVTTELSPFQSTAGAEAVAALAKSVRTLGHRVTVVSPLYKGIDATRHSLARKLTKIEVTLGDNSRYDLEHYEGRTASGLNLVFLGHALFGDVAGPSNGEISEDELRRAAILSSAALQVASTRDPKIELIHAHGLASVAAIWNAARAKQGSESWPILAALRTIDPSWHIPASGGALLGLPSGSSTVSLVAAVAQTGAQVVGGSRSLVERMTSELRTGGGKEGLAIPEGIDGAVWNPSTDSLLPARFDPVDLRGKQRSRTVLQQTTGLPVRTDVPLFVVPTEQGRHSGLDVLAEALPTIVRNDVQIVFVGEADTAEQQLFVDAQKRWPDRVALLAGTTEADLHTAFGGADFALVTSRQGDGAPSHLRAMRYGAIPVARSVGAHSEALIDLDAKLETGNAVLFEASTSEDLLGATRRAAAYFTQTEAFVALRKRVMRAEHTWERAARLFAGEYERLLGKREA